MRIALIALSVAACVVLTGCDRSRSPAELAAFEVRCAKLPYVPPEVVLRPIRVVDDDSRSLAELKAMYERSQPNHQTLGLTQVHIGHNAGIEVNGLQRGAGRPACFRAHVRVELFMEPSTIFVAREVAGDACRRAVVHEHEMKHVEVYETYLREAAASLGRSLPDVFDDRLYYAASTTDAQNELGQTLTRVLADFQARNADDLHARQREVDSVAEYARVASACSGASSTTHPMGRHGGPIAVRVNSAPAQ